MAEEEKHGRGGEAWLRRRSVAEEEKHGRGGVNRDGRKGLLLRALAPVKLIF